MRAVTSDIRAAIRTHFRQPGFALTVILTLAITVGATASVFAVVDAVLLRGLPYASPDRLVWVASVRSDNPSAPFTLPEYMDYRARTRSLSGLAALTNWSGTVAGDSATERLTGVRMSGNAFAILGATAAAGRLLTDTDDRPGAPPVVVLSHRFWQRRFGGSPAVIGTTLRINGEPYMVAGVLPAQFPMPVQELDLVTALKPDADPLRHLRNSVNFLRFFGRLADGTTVEGAQAELTTICGALREQFPVEYARKQRVAVVPLQEQLVGTQRGAMLMVFGAVIVVLAAALSNLVSLTLVRAQGRRAELTLRAAIGATRSDQLRLLTIEAALLTAIAAVAGWVMAAQMLRAAILMAPASVPRLGEASLDARSAVFTLTLIVTAAGLLIAAPFLAEARTNASEVLRSSRGTASDRWSRRIRDVVVTAEMAAALVLAVATFLLIKNLHELGTVDTGFDPERVFEARVSVPSSYRTPDHLARFYDRLADRLRESPDVTRFGVINIAPLSGLLATVPFSVEGQVTNPRDRLMANLRVVSPAYPETIAARLVNGRWFTEDDRAGTPDVALISEELAERFISTGAVGSRLLIDDNNHGPRPVQVIGVIGGMRHVALDEPPGLDIYLPLRQIHPDRVTAVATNQFWMVKINSDPAAFARTFTADLRSVDSDAAVSGARAMTQSMATWLAPRRFTLALFAAFASAAVLLAMLGLYGLVAYTVSQRWREIGVRMAIGASHRQVVRMIVVHAARLAAAGIVIGVMIGAAIHPALASLVVGINVDPKVVAIAALLLAVTALAAAWLPARRAAAIDPATALRAD